MSPSFKQLVFKEHTTDVGGWSRVDQIANCAAGREGKAPRLGNELWMGFRAPFRALKLNLRCFFNRSDLADNSPADPLVWDVEFPLLEIPNEINQC